MCKSGKHNDLENVGYTPRHHTFFEMLGNFSFGDYFKERAIELAWNLVTKDFGIDKKRLYVTVFHEDNEAFKFWKKIAGFSDDRIIKIPTSDNFWSMGETGPCGPCSEIFFDHGDHLKGGLPGTKDQEGDRYIEIWNLVFMQFEQVTKEKRINLPKPSVDTGMGLERTAALLQGTHDNYETDHFKKLIQSISQAIKKKPDNNCIHSFRVIADHLRASSFLIAEGVLPSNEGRGYVLRRIMRRGMRHSHLLGAKEPIFFNIFKTLQEEMSGNYPELERAQSLIKETLQMEEEKFLVLLERGIKILNEEISKIDKILSGEVAFKLYDTYGFPLDLTEDILKNKSTQITFESLSGLLIAKKVDNLFRLDFPSQKPKKCDMPKLLAEGLGEESKNCYENEDYLVVFDNEDKIANINPDFNKLRMLDLRGVIITAPGLDYDFVSRAFFPKYGILEDPVTGSAHTKLIPYWAEKFEKSKLKAKQIPYYPFKTV